MGVAVRGRAQTPATQTDLALVMQAPVAALRNAATSLNLVLQNLGASTVPVQIEVFTSSPGVSVGAAPLGCRLFSSPPTVGFD